MTTIQVPEEREIKYMKKTNARLDDFIVVKNKFLAHKKKTHMIK